jgi:hypothetical protein
MAKDTRFFKWLRRTELEPTEVARSVHAIGIEKTARAFELREDRLRDYMSTQGIPEQAHVDLMASFASIAEEVVNGANQLYQQSLPNGLDESFTMAADHATNDDLIGDLVSKSVELSVNGINPRAVGKETKVNKVNEKAAELRLYEVATQMFEHAYTYDNVIVLTNMSGNTINYIQPLDPRSIKVVPTYGFVDGRPGKKVYYKLSQDFINAYRKGRMDTKNVPAHWIQAMQKGADIDGRKMKNWVELLEEKGEVVFVINRKGKMDRLVEPTMRRIFPLIAMRRAKLEGEYSIDFHIKSLIHQVIIDKASGANSGSMWGGAIARATQSELDDIRDKYKSSMGKTIIEATTPEIDHKFHAPEFNKISPPTRYQHVEEGIERNFGFARTFTVGDGGGYSTAYVYTKGLIARINHWRMLIGNFLSEVMTKSAKVTVAIGFNNAVLKEAAQVLKELEFGVKNGILSPQTSCEELGYVNEFEVERKREAHTNKEDYIPVFEPSQSIVGSEVWGVGDGDSQEDDDGGRPPDGTGPQSKKDEMEDRPE